MCHISVEELNVFVVPPHGTCIFRHQSYFFRQNTYIQCIHTIIMYLPCRPGVRTSTTKASIYRSRSMNIVWTSIGWSELFQIPRISRNISNVRLVHRWTQPRSVKYGSFSTNNGSTEYANRRWGRHCSLLRAPHPFGHDQNCGRTLYVTDEAEDVHILI